MSNEDKIQVAEKRIIELQTLINHWKTSKACSQNEPADCVKVFITSKH